MRIKVDSKILGDGLKNVWKVVSSKSVLPILECFLVEVGEELYVSATNLEVDMRVSLGGEIFSKGRFCVPAKLMLDTIKSLKGELTLELVNNKLLITSDDGEFIIPVEDATDYPKIELPSGASVTMPVRTVFEGIRKTIYAVSDDKSRPELCGVSIVVGEGIVFTALNKIVLSEYTDYSVVGNSVSLVVPATSLKTVKATLPKQGNVVMNYSDNKVFFTHGGLTIGCRLIDAQYPNYAQVIPNNTKEVKIIKKNLEDILKRVILYANKDNTKIILSFSTDKLDVLTEDSMYSKEASESMVVEGDVEMEIGLNARFLQSILKSLDNDVVFKLQSPIKGIVIEEQSKTDVEQALMVIYPLKLR